MSVLSTERRKELERACVRGRRAAEAASRAAIGTLGVLDDRPPAHLSDGDRDLRRALRAKREQLGDEGGKIDLLVADCAYEQWHWLLFARFLAENNLLIHPQFEVQVTLAECDELAADFGEADAWAVAGRFAAEILPGIFRLDDPCVRLRLAPEGRLALEEIVESVSADTFAADDALGWVYQHWQKERKDEVNAADRKIGGADLAPVTQLFTENYMVRFLLENSLGAWWASRHPDSPLVREWEYLRADDDGKPVAGAFEGWPSAVAEVTVMDPCCGSGHFLVEAFGMLWRMRAEEEGLAPVAAQDAVLRDNLFGLELDPRCVQIAMFAVAVAAWKAGDGWRELPVPNVACSGIPVNAAMDTWKALADGDERLESALGRLHSLFKDADYLGSLIDPRQATEIAVPRAQQRSFDDVDWSTLAPRLAAAMQDEASDPATAVLGSDAAAVARSAAFLSESYVLVATNVPYLGRSRQDEVLKKHADRFYNDARLDLATMMLDRVSRLVKHGCSDAIVLPQAFLVLDRYEQYRRRLLSSKTFGLVGRMGARAFSSITGEVVNTCLVVRHKQAPGSSAMMRSIDVSGGGPPQKALELRTHALSSVEQHSQLEHPGAKVTFVTPSLVPYLGEIVDTHQGIATSDGPRFVRQFWELSAVEAGWFTLQSASETNTYYSGRSDVIYWQDGNGSITEVCQPGAPFRGQAAWGHRGVAVAQMSRLSGTLYTGERFDGSAVVLVPRRQDDLPAIWQFVCSGSFAEQVRRIDTKLRVSNTTMRAIPFDVDHWRQVADAAGPLPEPSSDDPTQWLFEGRPEVATEPLQVAVARLLGYRWPDQPPDDHFDPASRR